MSQGCFPPEELRLQIYADDPCSVVRGAPSRRTRIVATILMLWRVMGYSLAFHKGQLGRDLSWIGYQLKLTEDYIEVAIKDSFMKEFLTSTQQLNKVNLIRGRDLRRYTGQANHISGLLFAWRPFLDTLWAALAKSQRKGETTQTYVWKRQIKPSLQWFLCFLEGQRNHLCRQWWYSSFHAAAAEITMILDASPYGFGGVLIVNNIVLAYFADIISNHDVRIMKHQPGTAEGQQTWEALCLLIALRAWRMHWMIRRSLLCIKSDNKAALTLVTKLKAKGTRSIIAKELGLLYAESSYEPRLADHIPGVFNGLADCLSRLTSPDGAYSVPESLRAVSRTFIPSRPRSWYRSLKPR